MGSRFQLNALPMFPALAPVLLTVLTVACSAKSPSTGVIRSPGQGAVDADGKKETSRNRDDEESGTDSSGEESDPGDIAQNTPVPPTGGNSMGVDDTIVPPINQTGSNGKDKPNDPNQIVLNGFYFIKGAGSMKCLSVPNNSRDNGVQLQQRTCDLSSNHMKFEIEYMASEKAYKISNVANQKFVEVRNQSEVPQEAIQQGDYFGLQHQMFLFEVKSPGRFHIRTKTKQMFMDVTAASILDGAPIQLWGDGNGISSVWILEPTL